MGPESDEGFRHSLHVMLQEEQEGSLRALGGTGKGGGDWKVWCGKRGSMGSQRVPVPLRPPHMGTLLLICPWEASISAPLVRFGGAGVSFLVPRLQS